MRAERRREVRHPIALDAHWRPTEDVSAAPYEARCSNLSLGGAFFECPPPVPPFGMPLIVYLPSPHEAEGLEFELPATVRWTRPGGFGVQFGLLGARQTYALMSLVRRARTA